MKQKKPVYLLIFLPIILLWILPWVVGASVPAVHAFAFLLHQDGSWYIPLVIATVIYSGWCIISAVYQGDLITEYKGLWIILIVVVFAVAAIFGFTRNAAGHDVNVQARYQAFSQSNGWDK